MFQNNTAISENVTELNIAHYSSGIYYIFNKIDNTITTFVVR
jgi:hypothetical protein